MHIQFFHHRQGGEEVGKVKQKTVPRSWSPCAHSPKGSVDKDFCERVSAVPARAGVCAPCLCPWKDRNVVAADPDGGLPSTFDADRQRRAQQPAEGSSVVDFEEVSKDWEEVLAKIKKMLETAEIEDLDPQAIRPMPGQPRTYFNEAGLEDLGNSIQKAGQLQPGLVREVADGQDGVAYELIDGERRLRAIIRKGVPYFRAQVLDVEDAHLVAFIMATVSNFNRAEHTPLEIADAIHKMRTGPVKLPMKEIAQLIGYSEVRAYQFYSLQKLHPKVRDMLDPNRPKEKRLGVSAAVEIAKLPDKGLHLSMAERVLSGEVSFRTIRGEVVRVGREHGTPVRTRQLEPRKLFESCAARAGELKRVSGSMLAQIAEMRERNLPVLVATTPRGERVRDDLKETREHLDRLYQELGMEE
ncbi:ParB/RepB/Spo0J family partition protein [Candidatus Kaiserbacteria bacterium]|nr:ParB/RepB/Spo0J family partition protein [Candidatus Kaiserbacteria bacterium]